MERRRLEDFASRLASGRLHSNYVTGQCVFHDDHNPSLIVYADGWFRCFGCGARGKWSKLWDKISGRPARLSAPSNAVARLGNLDDFAYTAHQALKNSEGLMWQLERRKLEEAIDRFMLGWKEGWFVIPVFSREMEVQGIVFRADDEQSKISVIRYRTPAGQESMLYVPDWKLLMQSDGPMFVAFGMFDAITIALMGFPAASPTGGQNSTKAEWFDEMRRKIVFVPDDGEENAAHKAANKLDWRGAVMAIRHPDGCKDPNDMVVSGHEQELLRLLEESSDG